MDTNISVDTYNRLRRSRQSTSDTDAAGTTLTSADRVQVGATARPLSERERLVAACVVNGQALKVIAAENDLSLQAVSTYLERAKQKLAVRSRAELVAVLTREREPQVGAHAPTVHAGTVLEWRDATLLTEAEAAVLLGILQGQKNAQIAARRQTSVRTTECQAAAVMKKFKVRSRSELLALFHPRPPAPLSGQTRRKPWTRAPWHNFDEFVQWTTARGVS